jgi:hypothetical protein
LYDSSTYGWHAFTVRLKQLILDKDCQIQRRILTNRKGLEVPQQFTSSSPIVLPFMSSQSQRHITTDGRSVSMSLYRAPLWYLRPDLLPVGMLRSCIYGAPSLTRGRVCNLRCNHSMVRFVQNPKPYFTVSSQSKSKSHYNWRSVSHYVKVSSPFWDLWPDITFCTQVVFWYLLSGLSVCHLSKPRYNWRSVSHYVKVSSSFWDLWPDITSCPKVVFWNLLSCLFGAPSLTRGRGLSFVFLCLVIFHYLHQIFTLHVFYSSAIYIQ